SRRRFDRSTDCARVGARRPTATLYQPRWTSSRHTGARSSGTALRSGSRWSRATPPAPLPALPVRLVLPRHSRPARPSESRMECYASDPPSFRWNVGALRVGCCPSWKAGRRAACQIRTWNREAGFHVRFRRAGGCPGGVESSGHDTQRRHLSARGTRARFDGLFFVGITTTGVYCRPVCPSRVATPQHRRFFASPASAEHAGFRPCLRCRPELAPGRAQIDAVPRLARVAAHRIEAGALNGHSVGQLARELGVSERHLRRSLEREIGVSPVALAQTHRLLLAKRLLGDTELPVTRVAFASGFQSLRRFNALFRERYRLSPSALRPRPRTMRPEDDVIRLTLTYRAPLAWDVLLMLLGRDALAGVEVLQGGRYGRTVRLDGCSGVVYAEDTAPSLRDARRGAPSHLSVSVSSSLLAVLMPLLARLRHMFDLDAEPTAVDGHLACSGLGEHVRRRRGVRIPGAFDGFEAALRVLLRASSKAGGNVGRRVVHALGEPLETGIPALIRVAPTAERVADAGAARLAWLVGRRRSVERERALRTRGTLASLAGVRRPTSLDARGGARLRRPATSHACSSIGLVLSTRLDGKEGCEGPAVRGR